MNLDNHRHCNENTKCQSSNVKSNPKLKFQKVLPAAGKDFGL